MIMEEFNTTNWYAIKTRLDFRAEEALSPYCDEIFFPKREVAGGKTKKKYKAVIPHVLFIRTTRLQALRLEVSGRTEPGAIPLWIYRYPKTREPQVITRESIDLLRMLTADDTSGCRIYTVKDFRPGQRVRVKDGMFKGYEGTVQRIAKNRHVVVNLQGLCLVILPFIHPDLLEEIPSPADVATP